MCNGIKISECQWLRHCDSRVYTVRPFFINFSRITGITVSCRPSSCIDSETGRQQSAVRRTSGSLLQRYLGNSLWWHLWRHRRQSRLLQSRLRVSQLLCRWITKYLAVANRSRVSCAQNTSRTSTGLITQSPWNLLKIIGKRNHWIDHNTTYC